MDRCPKDETTAKNFVWNKSSSHFQEKLGKPLGGGIHQPPAIGGLIFYLFVARLHSMIEGILSVLVLRDA